MAWTGEMGLPGREGRQLEQSDRYVTGHGKFWLRNLMAPIERWVWERRGGQVRRLGPDCELL